MHCALPSKTRNSTCLLLQSKSNITFILNYISFYHSSYSNGARETQRVTDTSFGFAMRKFEAVIPFLSLVTTLLSDLFMLIVELLRQCEAILNIVMTFKICLQSLLFINFVHYGWRRSILSPLTPRNAFLAKSLALFFANLSCFLSSLFLWLLLFRWWISFWIQHLK